MWNPKKRADWLNTTRRKRALGRWQLLTFRGDLSSYEQCFFLMGRDEYGEFERQIVGVSLSTWRNRDLFADASFNIGSADEGDAHLFVAVPLAATVSLSIFPSGRLGRLVRRLAQGGRHGQRSLMFSVGGGDRVYIGLWFWFISFSIRDVLFGRQVFEPVETAVHETVIPMPEGDYPARVELSRRPWARPRGGRSGVETWAMVVLLDGHGNPADKGSGIPVPPLGDSDDYIMYNDEITIRKLTAETVEEAVAAVRDEIMTSRTRRATADWRPEPAVA
jgi:hypothetical protein